MFCSQCGAEVLKDGGFCPACGAPVSGAEKDAPESEAPPAPWAAPTAAPVGGAAAFPALGTVPPPPASVEATSFQAAASMQPMQPMQPGMPAPEVPPASWGAPVAAQQLRKSRKGLFIALGVVALVILIAVGGIVGFNVYRSNAYNDAVALLEARDYQQARDSFDKLGDYKDAVSLATLAQQWLDYEAAQALLDSEDFAGAKEAFLALGSFEDSADLVEFCQLNLDYLAAVARFDAGDFEAALEGFTDLAAVSFLDAATWKSKSFYAIAEGKLADGDRYGAYEDFKKLGSFEDSADRMKECTTEYPGNGEIYHNGSYISTRSAIKIDGGNAGFVSYYKIYSGETLVSTIFLHAGQSCTIEVPPGDYIIKQATGTDWFGEEIMFGDEGYYEKMTYDDGNDYFNLGDNIITTIVLSVSEGGNVGGDKVPRSSF